MPSPKDIGSIEATKLNSEEKLQMKFEDNEPFSALAFKVANDPFVGSLTFIRIYSENYRLVQQFIIHQPKNQKE